MHPVFGKRPKVSPREQTAPKPKDDAGKKIKATKQEKPSNKTPSKLHIGLLSKGSPKASSQDDKNDRSEQKLTESKSTPPATKSKQPDKKDLTKQQTTTPPPVKAINQPDKKELTKLQTTTPPPAKAINQPDKKELTKQQTTTPPAKAINQTDMKELNKQQTTTAPPTKAINQPDKTTQESAKVSNESQKNDPNRPIAAPLPNQATQSSNQPDNVNVNKQKAVSPAKVADKVRSSPQQIDPNEEKAASPGKGPEKSSNETQKKDFKLLEDKPMLPKSEAGKASSNQPKITDPNSQKSPVVKSASQGQQPQSNELEKLQSPANEAAVQSQQRDLSKRSNKKYPAPPTPPPPTPPPSSENKARKGGKEPGRQKSPAAALVSSAASGKEAAGLVQQSRDTKLRKENLPIVNSESPSSEGKSRQKKLPISAPKLNGLTGIFSRKTASKGQEQQEEESLEQNSPMLNSGYPLEVAGSMEQKELATSKPSLKKRKVPFVKSKTASKEKQLQDEQMHEKSPVSTLELCLSDATRVKQELLTSALKSKNKIGLFGKKTTSMGLHQLQPRDNEINEQSSLSSSEVPSDVASSWEEGPRTSTPKSQKRRLPFFKKKTTEGQQQQPQDEEVSVQHSTILDVEPLSDNQEISLEEEPRDIPHTQGGSLTSNIPSQYDALDTEDSIPDGQDARSFENVHMQDSYTQLSAPSVNNDASFDDQPNAPHQQRLSFAPVLSIGQKLHQSKVKNSKLNRPRAVSLEPGVLDRSAKSIIQYKPKRNISKKARSMSLTNEAIGHARQPLNSAIKKKNFSRKMSSKKLAIKKSADSISLSKLPMNSDLQPVPLTIANCINKLETSVYNDELYTKTDEPLPTKSLWHSFDSAQIVSLDQLDSCDPRSVSEFLIQLLNRLNTPVITADVANEIEHAAKKPFSTGQPLSEEERLKLAQSLHELPKKNLDTLRCLLNHMHNVVFARGGNADFAKAIANYFTPALIQIGKVDQTLLKNLARQCLSAKAVEELMMLTAEQLG